MRSSELKSHAEALAGLLLRPTPSSPAWAQFKDDIHSLQKCLSGYSTYLDKQALKTAENAARLSPVRSVSEHCTVRECSRADSVLEIYGLLDNAVKLSAGEPVFFCEEKHLSEPFSSNYERFRFLENVHLSVTVDMFKYACV